MDPLGRHCRGQVPRAEVGGVDLRSIVIPPRTFGQAPGRGPHLPVSDPRPTPSATVGFRQTEQNIPIMLPSRGRQKDSRRVG